MYIKSSLLEEKPIQLVDRILQDIQELANPKFQGRQAGTAGGKKSARFVAERFKTLGLIPVDQGTPQPLIQQWFQETPLTTTQLLTPSLVNLFSIQNQRKDTKVVLQVGKDYVPVMDSPAVNLTTPIVFVGYGISDPARRIDAYHNINVDNRIILFLRGKPPTYSRWITLEEKVHTAQEKGAAGFLTVTGPLLIVMKLEKV